MGGFENALCNKKSPDLVARAIRNAICANRFARIIRNWNPYFYSASGRFARITRISGSRESPDSRESCESIRANHATNSPETPPENTLVFCQGRFEAFQDQKPWQLETWQDSALFAPPGNWASFSTSWGDFLSKLHRKPGEKQGKHPLESIPKKNPVETAPRNCRFLSLVVVERVLSLFHAFFMAPLPGWTPEKMPFRPMAWNLAKIALSGPKKPWQPQRRIPCIHRAFLKGGGDLNPGERHSRDTRDDGTVTFCALRAATVLSRHCRADFGRPLTKKVMSHSRDGSGVTAPLRTRHCTSHPGVEYPPFRYPPFKSPRIQGSALQSRFLSKSDSTVGMEGWNPQLCGCLLCICACKCCYITSDFGRNPDRTAEPWMHGTALHRRDRIWRDFLHWIFRYFLRILGGSSY